ncbi:histidinol dehydrogenase [Candidatus Dependentiae bacterium]|nr:histidinol dehydrogenase [Candidatus Dependentiae bacterium]
MIIQNIKSVKDLILKRFELSDETVVKKVSEILSEVKKKGDTALINFTELFDKVKIKSIKVSEYEIEEAVKSVDDNFKGIISKIIKNIENYQRNTLPKSWIINENGSVLGELVNPLESVGLYIPGGTAPLISTILMSAVPARIAGVKNIYLCTPPDKTGAVNKYMLAAAAMCNVNGIFKIGGSQAVAALAYGTETVPKTDKIIGPGNIYVTIAKKLVYGEVNIDMIAGPSEILIYCDDSANSDYVIADLLSQAEHDVMASSYLVTTSKRIAEEVYSNIYKKASKLKRFSFIEESLKKNGRIFLTEEEDTAIEIINKIAPEHLEICVKQPEYVIRRIKNAGAIFVGNYTPEPIGDYFAGPSHILPTSGTSKFYSPVSADTFVKKTSLISYSKKMFMDSAADIIKFAELEELSAHAESIKERLTE